MPHSSTYPTTKDSASTMSQVSASDQADENTVNQFISNDLALQGMVGDETSGGAAASGRVRAQDTPAQSVLVAAMSALYVGTPLPTYAATGAPFTVAWPNAHATLPRIDLIVANPATGALTVTQGTAAASPNPPTYPYYRIPLWEIYVRPQASGAHVITDLDNGVNSYLLRDVRPFLTYSFQTSLETDPPPAASVRLNAAASGTGTPVNASSSGSKHIFAVHVHTSAPLTDTLVLSLAGSSSAYDTVMRSIAMAANSDLVLTPENGEVWMTGGGETLKILGAVNATWFAEFDDSIITQNLQIYAATATLAAAPLSIITNFTFPFKVAWITIHFSANQTFTAKIVRNAGNGAYDEVLQSVAFVAEKDWSGTINAPNTPVFISGDQIKITSGGVNLTGTYGIRIAVIH